MNLDDKESETVMAVLREFEPPPKVVSLVVSGVTGVSQHISYRQGIEQTQTNKGSCPQYMQLPTTEGTCLTAKALRTVCGAQGKGRGWESELAGAGGGRAGLKLGSVNGLRVGE